MDFNEKQKLQQAKQLMDNFSQRTGLNGNDDKGSVRYLWTDAFAVQTFLGLAHALPDQAYLEKAEKLIESVHRKLGRFTFVDSRKGWVSGLEESEGNKHPTAGGLRIGKSLPERGAQEPFQERLEWERDGQYFHYNTRWIHSLQKIAQETGNNEYKLWAAELMLACQKFIYRTNGRYGMFWKMSIDLSRPQVTSMGAHDPLEGLILSESLRDMVPEKTEELKKLALEFQELSHEMDWRTTDTLGTGGLLLNSVKAAEVAVGGKSVPEAMNPEKLLKASRSGLEKTERSLDLTLWSYQRLAFRECGLSLGLRVLFGRRDLFEKLDIDLGPFEKFTPLADEIEEFWLLPENQESASWKNHVNINAVSLAASLVTRFSPGDF